MSTVPGASKTIGRAGDDDLLHLAVEIKGYRPEDGGKKRLFFLSADAQLRVDEILIGHRAVGTLGAHASSVGSLTVPFPAGITADTYFVMTGDTYWVSAANNLRTLGRWRLLS